MWDRVFDHYVQEPMQKIVVDRIRPEGKRDAHGVEQAKNQLSEAYALLDRAIGSGSGRWATTSPLSTAPLPLPSLMRRR